MSDADAMLRTLLAVDEPPARDIAFTLAVMERVERRRFWLEVAMWAPVALGVCVALSALAPTLTSLSVSWLGPLGKAAFLPIIAIVLTLGALAFAPRDQTRV